MRIRIVCVGDERRDPMVPLVETYLDRLKRHTKVELVHLRKASRDGLRNPDEIRQTEAERILKATTGDCVIALDPTGPMWSTEVLARHMDGWITSGVSGLSFVIGGPLGLSDAVLRRAQQRWCLTSLTLPHRMVRLIVAEQIYRVFTILKGEPYHK